MKNVTTTSLGDGNRTAPLSQESEWIETVAALAETYDANLQGRKLDRSHRAIVLNMSKVLYRRGTPFEILRPAVARVARNQLRPQLLYSIVDEVHGDCQFTDIERRHASLTELMRCDCRLCAQESVRQSRRPSLES